MKTVILLGSEGQLGRLVASTAPDTIELFSFCRETLDITDHRAVNKTIQELSPDIIINTAAYTAVDNAEKQQQIAHDVNGLAVENIAKISTPDTRIIHLSTDFVFSNYSPAPYKQDDPIAPVSVYGETKALGEKALIKHHPGHSIILRTSWLYSAQGNNFVTTMLRLMGEKKELSIVSDQYGSPTSARLLAEIIWKLALKDGVQGIYHWSDRGVISWYDFALEIYAQARKLGILHNDVNIKPVTTDDYPTAASRPRYSALDSATTETISGIKTRPWQEELYKILQEIKGINK